MNWQELRQRDWDELQRMPVPRDPFGPYVDSYMRMRVVLDNLPHMDRAAWFRQLGEAWPSCDNLWRYRSTLRRVLVSAEPAEIALMMTEEEREAHARLPDRIEVWRGCYSQNRAGLSWTTSREVAEGFPLLNRYRGLGVPVLRKGWTRRDHAASKLDRSEAEIIAPRVFGIVERPIALPKG